MTFFSLREATTRSAWRWEKMCIRDRMQPVSSVCALVFSHPESTYFSVGVTGEDQQEDYASRKLSLIHI